MPKPDSKTTKRQLRPEGEGPVLTHNPFGALQGAEAAAASHEPPQASGTTPVATPEAPRKSRGRLLLRREKKRRGGKTVVVVAGLCAQAHLAESEIAALAQQLKQQLGCGGSLERVPGDSELVLQGDQPERVAELLRELGFRVDGVGS